MTDLSPRYQIFADARLRGASQTDAAIQAGYTESNARKTGSVLGTNQDIASYIASQQQLAADSAQLSVQWVLDALTETYLSARAEQQHATAHATAVSIGKHLGMWPNKLRIDRGEAEAVASQLGVDVDEVVAEAERMLKEAT